MSSLLIPLLAAFAATPMGGVAPAERSGAELFTTASLVPSDAEIFVHVQDASALRRIIELRPTGAALGRILDDMEVLAAWDAFAGDLRSVMTAQRGPRWSEESAPILDEEQLFDLLLGRELTLAARRARPWAAQEWALISHVDPHLAAPLLAGLPHRVDGLGWRTLVGHELAYCFEGSLLLLAPAGRQRLAEDIRALGSLGGERLSGTTALAELRARWPVPQAGATIEVLLLDPRQVGRPILAGASSPSTVGAGWRAFMVHAQAGGQVQFWHHTTSPGGAFDLQPLTALESVADQAAGRTLDRSTGLAMVRPVGRLPEASQHVAMSPGAPRSALSVGAARGGDGAVGDSSAASVAPGSRSELLAEIRAGQQSTEAQHAALAARLRRLHDGPPSSEASTAGSTPPADPTEACAALIRRVSLGLPGDFPRSGASDDAARGEAAAMGQHLDASEDSNVTEASSSPLVMRVVPQPQGELLLLGIGRDFVDALAREIASPSDAGGGSPSELCSAGVMPGALLAELFGASSEGGDAGDWPASFLSLVRTLDRIEWRVHRPEGAEATLKATAQLPPPRLSASR
jgi:hypothetical protein